MAIPGIYSPGQAAGVQLGGAITPQTVAQSVGQAQFATSTGVRDTEIGLNAIQQNGQQVGQYVDRVGKTASMMADIGATIGKYLDDQSYRNEALAIAPIKALTTTIGLNRIAAGDMRGYGDVTTASSMGAGNPFLARMDAAATSTANNLADNYTQNLLQQERQKWQEQLYGIQQGGREDLFNMRQDERNANSAEAESLYTGRGGGAGGGGMNPVTGQPSPMGSPQASPQGEGAPEDYQEPPLPEEDEPDMTQPPVDGPDVTGAPQAEAVPGQAAPQGSTLTFDDQDNVINSNIDWSNQKDVDGLLKSSDIPDRVKQRVLMMAHQNQAISDEDFNAYTEKATGRPKEQAIQQGQRIAMAVGYANQHPLESPDQAQELADKAGIDTLTVTPEEARIAGGLIGWPATKNKGVKISTTTSKRGGSYNYSVGPGGKSYRESGPSESESTTYSLDQSGLPDGIKSAAKDYVDNLGLVASNAELSDWVKRNGGLVAGDFGVDDTSAGTMKSSKIYAIVDGEKKYFTDSTGSEKALDPKFGEAITTAKSALNMLQSNQNQTGTRTLFLRVQPGQDRIKQQKPEGIEKSTWDTLIQKGINPDDIRSALKASGGKVDDKFTAAMDSAEMSNLDKRLGVLQRVAQSDNATEDDIKRLSKLKSVKRTKLQDQLDKLVKLKEKEQSDKDEQRRTSSEAVISQPIFASRTPASSQYDAQIADIQKQIEALK